MTFALGTPSSCQLGTPGSCGMRFSPVTASTLTRFSAASGSVAGMDAVIAWIVPPSRSFVASAMPRYGTCTTTMPARAFMSSSARWLTLPAPADP